MQEAHGDAAEASAFLSSCMELPEAAADAAAAGSPSAGPGFQHFPCAHEHSAPPRKAGSTGKLQPAEHELKLSRVSMNEAAADGFSSPDDAALNSSSGPDADADADVEDIYASWDRLLQDGGHNSSPTSAVAVVQVQSFLPFLPPCLPFPSQSQMLSVGCCSLLPCKAAAMQISMSDAPACIWMDLAAL